MMSNTIQKDHEICCKNCGCVLATIEDYSHSFSDDFVIPRSIDMALLGSAINKTKFRDPKLVYEERALFRLSDLVRKFDLPERFAIETINEMKRKKSGFRSENEPIKILIKILSKDDNFIFIKKLRAIKARYEKTINY